MSGVDDPTILAWAAEAGRVLITHDVKTIIKYAYERLVAELAMPGVMEVNSEAALPFAAKVRSKPKPQSWQMTGLRLK